MRMRSNLLIAALGLLASLALTAPSQAGSVLATTTVNFGTLFPSSTPPSLTEIDITYAGATLSSLNASGLTGGLFITVSPPTITPEAATVTLVGNTVEIKFASAVTYISGSYTMVASAVPTISYVTKPPGVSVNVGLSTTAVPEPSSMALLGIAMTSFVAFRRFFKRVPVV